jgi:thioredoxin reductase
VKRLVVIGAGPVGLAAALGGAARGAEVTLFERDRVGGSLRRWGETRLYSPLEMNVTDEMLQVLGSARPDAQALLTGPEFVEQVLEPVAASLGARVVTGHRVLAVGRAGMTRGDHAGHPLRAERPFRLLVEGPSGERWVEADAVIDASGTYGNPVRVGAGGLMAPGERAVPVLQDLGALHAERGRLEGRRVLLVGHGHSAAHGASLLARAGSQVTWLVRSPNRHPVVDVANDPLPERHRVVAEANVLAASPPPGWIVHRRAQVEWLRPEEGAVRVGFSRGGEAVVDAVVGLTGYRPDLSLLSELAVQISPVTEGAAGIARALADVTDCLSVPAVSARDLASGEPGFYLAGAKSYGRARTFLLRTGYTQLATLLDEALTGAARETR